MIYRMVAIAIFTSSCASSMDPSPGVHLFDGTYKYESGDLIVYPCVDLICEKTLVRDKRLYSLIKKRGPSVGRIQFYGRVVKACDDELSSEIACVTSSDGEAVVIERWVDDR